MAGQDPPYLLMRALAEGLVSNANLLRCRNMSKKLPKCIRLRCEYLRVPGSLEHESIASPAAWAFGDLFQNGALFLERSDSRPE